MAALAFGALALGGCSSQPEGPTAEQVWIQAHPTHAGPNGECIESDDEPCDSDPFDLGDMGDGSDDSHKTPSTVRTSSPKPSVIPGQRAPIRITPKRR